MPYADALAKRNHFFGTFHSGGIYLYKTASSKSLLDAWTPRYLLLTSGHLLMQTTLYQASHLSLQ